MASRPVQLKCGSAYTGVFPSAAWFRDGRGRSPVDVLEGPWWLVHTKARNEKALAADLDRLGVGCYLPLAHTSRRYGGRTVFVDIPLFPGYLFLSGGPEERLAALGTNRVANVIRVVAQERLKADLRQIFRVTTSNTPVDVYPGIRRGRRCRVTHGCLKGIEGVVIRRRGVCRVYISVVALGQSAEVEIDASLLAIVE
jgi:transcription antitermination factor NusG